MGSFDKPRNESVHNLPVLNQRSNRELALYDDDLNRPPIEGELDMRALWRVLVRYRRLMSLIFVTVVVAAMATTMMKREIYSASALLEINTAGRNIVKFQNVQSEEISASEHLSTQSRILASKAVAEEVIRRLDLIDDPELSGKIRQRTVKNGLKRLIKILKPSAPRSYSDEVRKNSAIKRYLSRLSISPIRKSTLINVKFRSFDPEMSAKIVNEHMNAYIWLSSQRRYNSTSGAKSFLNKEIENVQKKLASSQKELTEFARVHGVIDIEDRNNIMLERMAKLNSALSEVQNDRINAETKYIQSQSESPGAIVDVIDDELVKTLKQDLVSLNAQYLEKAKIYKPGYPSMQQLKAKINELEVSIDYQMERRLSGLKTNFEQLDLREERLKSELQDFKAQMLNVQDRSVQYGILKRELDANKQLYAGLLERTKEVGVAAGMELNVGSVVDHAIAPRSASSPVLLRSLITACLFAAVLALMVALLLAILDNTIADEDQLRKVTQLSPLGIAPTIEPQGVKPRAGMSRVYMVNTIAHHHPDSGFSEAMQSVRTSLAYTSQGGLPKSLMVTSAMPGEGKSTIAMNLAVSYAKSGYRVVIVDGDLRNSKLHDVFSLPRSPGLADVLEEGISETLYGFKEIEHLSMLVSGCPSSASPVDLLGSNSMQELLERFERDFDLVIIDSPPIGRIADSILISRAVDAVLMVVAADKAPQDEVKRAMNRLRMVNAPVVGTILNKASGGAADYGAGYGKHRKLANSA